MLVLTCRAVDYLIHPKPTYSHSPRLGAGIAIIVVFYVLLFCSMTTYLRLCHKVIFNPDFTPRGEACEGPDQDRAGGSRGKARGIRTASSGDDSREKNDLNSPTDVEGARDQTGGKAYPLDPAGLESFYMKDVFVCQQDGRPPYCSKCCQFKTDRAHHNSDMDRCVRRLDHFCPWCDSPNRTCRLPNKSLTIYKSRVGGVVSESSHKFFIQFLFYTAILCGFILTVVAIFTAELKREVRKVAALCMMRR
jgi:palmitoyltransferase